MALGSTWKSPVATTRGGAPVEAGRVGWFRRLFAHVIDGMIASLLSFLAITLAIGFGASQDQAGLAFFAGAPAINVLLAGWGFSGRHRATFGKRMLGAQVVRVDGQPIGFLRGVAHALALGLSLSLLLPVALITLFFRRDRRGLHELIAGTVTVPAGALPAEGGMGNTPRVAAPAMAANPWAGSPMLKAPPPQSRSKRAPAAQTAAKSTVDRRR